jgi:UDP-glucose 4-epimerase
MCTVNDAALCVVLGGSGFLGQRLCRGLLASGFRVRSVSRSGRPSGNSAAWWSDVEWISAAIGTTVSARALHGADFLFHLASTTLPSTSNDDISYDLQSNVVATVQTLEAAVSAAVRRVVFVSSGGTVYGIARQIPIPETHPTDPICSHGIQKLSIEKYLYLFRSMKGLDSVILRVSNMYGESQGCNKPLGAVAHFAAKAINGTALEIWGDGTTTRDYVHVDDVVVALIMAIRYEGAERVFNIGTGCGTSLAQLVNLLRERAPWPVTVNYGATRGFDVPESVLDIGRARRELLWSPEVTLEGGLDRVIQRAKVGLAACI